MSALKTQAEYRELVLLCLATRGWVSASEIMYACGLAAVPAHGPRLRAALADLVGEGKVRKINRPSGRERFVWSLA